MPTSFRQHLAALERADLFAGLEQAATQVGLGLFVVQVDAMPPVILYASELLSRLVGRPVLDLFGVPCWELVAVDERDRVRNIIASRGPGSPPICHEFAVDRPDQTRITVEVGIARIAIPSAQLAVCYFRDVTHERSAVRALRDSDARFRKLIDNAPDGVIILQEGRIVLANPVGARMFGLTDPDAARGRALSEFLPGDDTTRAQRRIAQVSQHVDVGPSEYHVLVEPERIVEVHSVACEWEGAPANLAFVRDVTERKRMQQDLVRADRLAVVGTMAAAVAHEINNPMTYLLLALHRVERELEGDPDSARVSRMRGYLRDARDGADRVSTIVRALPTFSRDDDSAVGPVDLVQIVERAIVMAEHALRYRARLIRNYAPALPTVEAISGRVEQVVGNLLLNAIDALVADDFARNEICVEIRVQDGVRFTVRDNRRGLGPPDSEAAFDPLHAADRAGDGPRLGLAVCKWIVEDMNGRIEVSTPIGGGSEVSVTLPASTGIPVLAPVEPAQPTVMTRPRHRILVIDDEPLIRTAIAMALSDQHVVVEADRGEVALELIGDGAFDVILCDLMMPGLGGCELHGRIKTRHPGLERRIVFVTGGTFVAKVREFLDSVDNLKLFKPFTLDQVSAIVVDAARR